MARTNWKASYLRMEKVVDDVQRSKLAAEKQLAALQEQLRKDALPWKIAVRGSYIDCATADYAQVKRILDAGVWFLTLEKQGVKYRISIGAQTISYPTKDAAREGARKLMDAGVWFVDLEKGG